MYIHLRDPFSSVPGTFRLSIHLSRIPRLIISMIRNFFGLLGLALLMVLVATSCTLQEESMLSNDAYSHGFSVNADLNAYRLGTGDVVSLTVFGEPELSGQFELDGQGAIDLPLVSGVKLAGLTARQAMEKIKSEYSKGYLQDPSITIKITKYRPFYIMGEIRAPGEYPYKENITVLEAVAAAKGFTYRANQKRIEIVRKMPGDKRKEKKVFSATKHSPEMPGDVIKVKERFF